jgi:hypothetical protein
MSETAIRIYVAHPITTYGTEWAAACLDRLSRLLPDVELIDPERKSWSTRSWLYEWPWVLGGSSAVVVFGDGAGTVGTGCLHEIADALFLGLPVWAFDGRRLVELTGFEILPEERRTARRAAILDAETRRLTAYQPPLDRQRLPGARTICLR